ncbi:MAG: N-acetyl-gamma-glutamyl-phosphate reductase [Rhodospirillaceae bacterium]|nr:N-acetyl-gamma-glutamyl-phosphate reductase [Rhodospirillaceae bacterium]
MKDLIKVGILGASGYTGAELINLLTMHKHVAITQLAAGKSAGSLIGEIYPHLARYDLPILVGLNEVDWNVIDFIFSALPHGSSQKLIAEIPHRIKVVDLSADFRIKDTALYENIYNSRHFAPDLQAKAVYGLSEHNRKAIKEARLVANPGCYPTSALLPLIPLVQESLIDVNNIIIDSKSGTTGAGRGLNESLLFSEVSGGMHAYALGSHRHAPEIDQELNNVSEQMFKVTFTPHLIPMSRGIFSTIYLEMEEAVTMQDIRQSLEQKYNDESFVHVLKEGDLPATRHVIGSNHCLISIDVDRKKGKAIICSVEDNLVKGAAGQAVQNMNIMMGYDESEGLRKGAVFP